jgi:hypothetical protein
MTWFLILLGASIFSSIFVLAAGMLSSRMNRRENLVENFYTDSEAPAQSGARTAE